MHIYIYTCDVLFVRIPSISFCTVLFLVLHVSYSKLGSGLKFSSKVKKITDTKHYKEEVSWDLGSTPLSMA